MKDRGLRWRRTEWPDKRVESAGRVSLLAGDVRAGLVGALGLLALTAGVRTVFDAPPAVIGLIGIVILSLAIVTTQRARQRQRRIAAVLGEDSSSTSALRLVELVEWLLFEGEPMANVRALVVEVTRIRPHPHLEILSWLLAFDDDQLDRQEVLRHLRIMIQRRERERAELITQLQRHLEAVLGRNSLMVLYGYSKTVCDSIIALREVPPILVLEDRQYGREADREHEQVQMYLTKMGIPARIVEFERLEELVRRDKFRVLTADGSISLLPSRRLVCVLGCDVVDLAGRALLPGVVAGRPSDTAQVAELMGQQGLSDLVERRLIIAAESFKVVDDLDACQRSAAAPIHPARWIGILHSIGLAVPVQMEHVDLYEVPAGLASIVTPTGIRTREELANGIPLSPPDPYWVYRSQPDRSGRTAAFRRIGALVLDWNGVIVQDEDVHYTAFAALVAKATGLDLSREDYGTLCGGLSDVEGISSLVEAGLLDGDVEELVREKRLEYLRRLEAGPPLLTPGITELLESARDASVPIRVLSASAENEITRTLEATSLGRWISSDNVMAEVPSTERKSRLKLVIARLGVDPTCVLYLDDSRLNLESAARLGVNAVLMPSDDPSAARDVLAQVLVDYAFEAPG